MTLGQLHGHGLSFHVEAVRPAEQEFLQATFNKQMAIDMEISVHQHTL
jgi:hypothetical protein